MVSIAHWLDTFTCSKYADRFERSGYQNIQSVCHLTTAQLQALGIANNDIYTIMENVLLLKQSVKSVVFFLTTGLSNPPRYLDLNSEPPPTTVRSRTASPAINTFNRTMNQNPNAYSPGPNVSTPPTSSGPSPDRGLPGPSPFDSPSAYHRSNSFPNPVNPNTFFDISPSSSTSSPHRSTSIDTLPPPMEGGPFNDYLPQPSPHQFQPPGMIYRGGNVPAGPPGGYYNPPHPRFYSPDQQQQFMYSNQRMMMHPQQHPSWGGHRPPLPHPPHPPPPSSHPMHYPYEHHQFRMAPPPQFCHPNHPIMSDHNSMFINQQQQQQNMNSGTSNKLSTTAEPHPHPLQSLERLVLLPESQVIDPKSVVNEIHDPQSPFSESLSPYGTLSPKNSVSTPPTATIVSNLLTNEKSIIEQHTKPTSGLKRSSTHDERNELNKKNRLNTTNDLTTGDSIINNHPVVTSLLTRGLSNSTSQAPLPSIKSLQQKHNPSFIQQQQQRQQQMMFQQNQPDPQQFVDGLINEIVDDKMDVVEQDYEQLITKLRLTIDTTSKQNKLLNLNTIKIPTQLDGVTDPIEVTTKSPTRTLRNRDLSTSSERGTSNSENRSSSTKNHLDKSTSDPTGSSQNGTGKKRHDSLNNNNNNHTSYKRRLSENNIEINSSINGHHSNSILSNIQKPKVIQSPTQSNVDHEASSSSESTPLKLTTHNSSDKPIREAKKRSLIYTGNTREFLETAIAAGIIDDNGDEEDEDNEYIPPGGIVELPLQRLSSSSSSSENEDESIRNGDDSGGSSSNNDDDDDENEGEDEKNSGDEMIVNEEPSESNINWNVRNRPQRHTHLIRFDNISQQDEQQFFGALQEQVPELAAYLNENSDDEYEIKVQDMPNDQKKSRKSSTKKTQRNSIKNNSEQDEQTVEIMKKFRHVNVPSEKSTKKKSHSNESTTISIKNRSEELYVILNDSSTRTIMSGTHLDTTSNTKKNSTIQGFNFHRRQIKMKTVEDTKAQWRCILCWKEPYEEYLGPLYGPFQLNEQCRLYLNNNKQLAKHYRKLIEVWLHRDCALWNNHIQMNPTTGELMYISDACSTYLDITCSICQLPGAALACRYRNCKIRYHYPCAKTTLNCQLIEESYSIYCPKHNQINNNKSKKNRRKTATSANDSQESLIT
ncbi:unnamed protein product [Rotaria sp. Silwood2]|nr:unnamed protein product [Rotaria sp. Silwood2]CAF2466509.1 unnamed protein product [Rotaria sp. Silwood2]CAF3923255.1 unnamed protein product [Rotaria sp. Silwood2]CAF3933440.1 unnamed protein product [Rotaria sp. Silwood2]